MSYIDQITIGSSSYDIQDSTVPAWARASNAPVESVNGATGIVTLTAADIGAISAPSSATADAVLAYNGTAWVADKRMVILSYGSSTWTDFINAYNNNAVIYCRASSNSNPATGAQTRMAFMAYVNSATPTNVEFQYYRSVSSHTAAQQGDQVFIYKLDKTAGWSVTTREAYTKIAVGTGLSSSYSSGVLTLTNGIASATADPLMDGTAAVGSSSKYAKEDHVHPTDTSRASAASVEAITPKTASITLAAANWTGNGPYTQTVTISGATITSNTLVDLRSDATVMTQLVTDGTAALFVENNAGTLTAYAIGTAPTANLTIQCTLTEAT